MADPEDLPANVADSAEKTDVISGICVICGTIFFVYLQLSFDGTDVAEFILRYQGLRSAAAILLNFNFSGIIAPVKIS